MATLSRDNGSDWRASGLRRRDFRHAKDGPEEPRARALRPAKRELLRRWCRGKVGQEHLRSQRSLYFTRADGSIVPYITFEACSRCGKRTYDWDRRRTTIGTSSSGGPTSLAGSVWEIVRVRPMAVTETCG